MTTFARNATRLFVSVLAVAALGASAHAADKLRLERTNWGNSPYVRYYLSFVDTDGRAITGKTANDFKLSIDSMEQGVARASTTFDQTDEAINVVVVAQNNSAMQEVMEQLKSGIRALSDGIDAKKKSKIGLVTFASEPKKAAELGAPSDVEGAAGTIAVDEGVEVHMLDAVRAAIDMLSKGAGETYPQNKAPKTTRKLIVLFSDGIDVNMERRAFAAIGKRALENGVVIDTIGYAPFEAGKLKNLSELAKQSNGTDRQARNGADLTQQFIAIVDEIKKQYVVDFYVPLKPEKPTPKEHGFQVVFDSAGKQLFSNTLNERIWDPSKPYEEKPSRWWIWVLVGVGVLIIVLLVLWLIFRDKEEPMPEVAPPPEPVVAAPQPSGGKMRTMALDISGGGKAALVGWMVATNGKHANQTFKFKSGGRTLIGTAPDCDIVIDDGFMSAQHCEVRIENGTFKLVDLGSTNGILVNSKKVPTHELVDNDVFQLGRTEFKFKSIS